jgi:virginiamycin A acetyltransferase
MIDLFDTVPQSLALRARSWMHLLYTGWFRRHGTSSIFAGTNIREIELEGENLVCERCSFKGKIKLGRCSTIGPYTAMNGAVTIGRYSQIAAYVAMYAIDHKTTHLTTFVSSTLFNGELKRFANHGEIQVGNDVWIGHGSIVLKGIKIGDGAIVGAGAVVTRDVAPYTIVAGNPARELRKRFDDEVISLLQQLQWWNRTKEELETFKDLFTMDFAENRDAAVARLRAVVAKFAGSTPAKSNAA